MVGNGRYYALLIIAIMVIGFSFSLQVTDNKWEGSTEVNTTICHDFGIINDENSTFTVSLSPTGDISSFTLFNTTTLTISPNETKYFRACFTPDQVGSFSGSININKSSTIYPILITVNGTYASSQQSSGGCGLLPSISQYNARLSQGTNTSYVIHIKNTCSQPITSISATIQNAKPDFAYVTGNIPGQLDPGQTLDITVNIDGSKETEGQKNFYLTVSGFIGNNRTSTNVNFNIYIVAGGTTSTGGVIGSPAVTIPAEGYVNSTYQIAVTGISSSDLVFIDIQPTNFELKNVDRGVDYYKADYSFTKDGQYSIIVRIYHSGSLYYQTSKNVVIHPPSASSSSGSGQPSIAKILWLVRNRIESHEPIRIEVRTEGGDPVAKAWVKVTLPDGNFLSADTDSNGVVIFQPSDYGYQNGFPEGTATIDVRKTGFAQDTSSPRTIQIYINRIPAQLIVPQTAYVGEEVQVKLINKNTGEVIDYNGVGHVTGPNNTQLNINFKNGYASFVPDYNGSYSVSVDQNNVITSASVSIDVKERPIVAHTESPIDKYSNYIIGIVAIAILGYIIYSFKKGRKRKLKPTFKYAGFGKVGSIATSVSTKLPDEESNVVEVIGDNK